MIDTNWESVSRNGCDMARPRLRDGLRATYARRRSTPLRALCPCRGRWELFLSVPVAVPIPRLPTRWRARAGRMRGICATGVARQLRQSQLRRQRGDHLALVAVLGEKVADLRQPARIHRPIFTLRGARLHRPLDCFSDLP